MPGARQLRAGWAASWPLVRLPNAGPKRAEEQSSHCTLPSPLRGADGSVGGGAASAGPASSGSGSVRPSEHGSMAGEVLYGIGVEVTEKLGLKHKEGGGGGALAGSSPPPSPRRAPALAAPAAVQLRQVGAAELPVLSKVAAESPAGPGSC